jgi:hypothetical protein
MLLPSTQAMAALRGKVWCQETLDAALQLHCCAALIDTWFPALTHAAVDGIIARQAVVPGDA